MKLSVVFLGLSITSSWGNGHATTYRALAKALSRRGHAVTFLERDVSWYREHRDLEQADYCNIVLYETLGELGQQHTDLIRDADLVILGSYVPDGVAVGDWLTAHARGVTAFYDIDTPVTLSALDAGECAYLTAGLVPRFDIYLSFTGGPALKILEDVYRSPAARALYCSADVEALTGAGKPKWALGYIGTYSDDRQPALEELLLASARQLSSEPFVVAGPKYPESITWPQNVTRIPHLPPAEHPSFYRSQRYTLNITRADMKSLGYSPSVRLFEAAACGAPIISDEWPGLETIFTPGQEILVAQSAADVVRILKEIPEERRLAIAAKAHARFLREHTPEHRARQIERYHEEALQRRHKLAVAQTPEVVS